MHAGTLGTAAGPLVTSQLLLQVRAAPLAGQFASRISFNCAEAGIRGGQQTWRCIHCHRQPALLHRCEVHSRARRGCCLQQPTLQTQQEKHSDVCVTCVIEAA